MVHAGKEMDRSNVSYGLTGSTALQSFGVLSALGTVAFSFGDTILPEIQATCKVSDVLLTPADCCLIQGLKA